LKCVVCGNQSKKITCNNKCEQIRLTHNKEISRKELDAHQSHFGNREKNTEKSWLKRYGYINPLSGEPDT